ncbi:MAG: hypothetical protein HY961_16115 [Ignavibacteriae bacterium]|nr:hypothetical protein [Ignavibacteriota bacterium]
MHLQQTKRGSRLSGGPQYYFHDLSEPVKIYLREKGAVQVALVTPYGATKSDYFAVSADKKLDAKHRPISGNVGHDRVQQGTAGESIGESIRFWYKLPDGDFERIDLDIDIRDEVFYLTPLKYKFAEATKHKDIRRIERPLSFTRDYASPLWTRQLVRVEKRNPGIVSWALDEICRVVKVHRPASKLAHIQETDLLRASGPLKHLGVQLGGYVGKGYDCMTDFCFLDFPIYTVPVEIKRNSAGFEYQQHKYGKHELSRAVVLCAIHGHKQMPPHIDVIELEALCTHARQFPSSSN